MRPARAVVPRPCQMAGQRPAVCGPSAARRGPAHRIGELTLPLIGGMQVDQRSPGAAMTHAFHQLAQARARVRGQRVPRVAQVMEMHAVQPGGLDGFQPGPAVEVAVPQRGPCRAGEHEPVIAVLGEASRTRSQNAALPRIRPASGSARRQRTGAAVTLACDRRCRICPFIDQGGACGAGGRRQRRPPALADPGRRTPGHACKARRSRQPHCPWDLAPGSYLPRGPIVQLAATASRFRRLWGRCSGVVI